MTHFRFRSAPFARIILLAITFFTILPLASSVAQTYYVPSDSDHVQVLISGLKQNITLWKAGDVGVSVWGDVSCEGTTMSPARLNDTLSQLIAFTTERGMRPSGPSADQFGVFWDFQLDYTTMGFNGNVCSVPCTFSLFAGGSRKVSGLIECVKEDLNWRISRIDGLLPLLSAEALSSIRKGTAAGHTSPTGASKRK